MIPTYLLIVEVCHVRQGGKTNHGPWLILNPIVGQLSCFSFTQHAEGRGLGFAHSVYVSIICL